MLSGYDRAIKPMTKPTNKRRRGNLSHKERQQLVEAMARLFVDLARKEVLRKNGN